MQITGVHISEEKNGNNSDNAHRVEWFLFPTPAFQVTVKTFNLLTSGLLIK